MNTTAELVGLPESMRNVMFHWNLIGYHNEKHRPTEEQHSRSITSTSTATGIT